MELALPIVVFLLLAAAFLMLWFGLFIVHRPGLRIAMFIGGLVLFSAASIPIVVALAFTHY